MTELVLPVGHYLGRNQAEAEVGSEAGSAPIVDTSTPAAAPAATHVLRVGWRLLELDDEQFTVWALGHGMPEGPDMAPWTVADLLGAARATGVPRPHEVLEDLVGRELVFVVPTDTDIATDTPAGSQPASADAVELAQDVRLRSLLRGVGRDEAGRQCVGALPGQVAVALDPFAFEVWTWAPHCDSLWHLGEILAAAGVPGPGATDPAALVPLLLHTAQLLLAHGVGYLDEAHHDEAHHDDAHHDDADPTSTPSLAGPVDAAATG